MRDLVLILIFFVSSCAFAPKRNIASVEVITFGSIDSKHSIVRLFPNRTGHPDLHHFYLELRDLNKKLIDVDLGDIALNVSSKIPSIYIRRISIGRYEIQVSEYVPNLKKLNFKIQNKILKLNLLNEQKPSQTNSSITVISNDQNILKLRLTLRDEKNSLVKLDFSPDIIFEGTGTVSMPQMVKQGIWELEVSYPEMNQIMYFSIRANGALLERLLRHQHIEK